MKKKTKKTIKKVPKSIYICLFLFLSLGLIGGYFTVNILTKNDTFELIGEKNITLNLNQEYSEQGVKVISFGKNLNDKVEIASDLDTSKEGEYTIIYTIKDSYKYKNIKRVRYVSVRNGSDQDAE